MYTYFYLAELIVAFAAIALGISFFWKKKPRHFFIYCALCVIGFFALFAGTFLLEKPQVQTEDTLVIEAHSGQKLQKPKTRYHFRDVTGETEIKGEIDYEKAGEYPVVIEVKTTTGVFEKAVTVIVTDTKAPELVLFGQEEMTVSYKAKFSEPGYQATDACDGDLSDAVEVTKSEADDNGYLLRYTVSDSSGNQTEKIRTVHLIDDIKPKLTLNGASEITVYLNKDYTEKGAKAVDEKDGDLTEKIAIEGKVNTAKEGTYTVTYRVSDTKGNEAVATRKVLVKKFLKAQDGSKGNRGVVYLTFDDGPSSNITPKILDILKEKNVKATFFVINYDAAGERLIQREHNEGHTVAIHGYSHNYKTIYRSEEAYMENLVKLQKKIEKSTGTSPTVTRFPGGSSNLVSRFNPGIMTRLCRLVREKGFTYFDWNVSSGDAGGAKTANEMYNNVVRYLSKSRQNVVLMHDFSSNSKLLDALPRIIDYGIEHGYAFDRITASTPMVTHTPNN